MARIRTTKSGKGGSGSGPAAGLVPAVGGSHPLAGGPSGAAGGGARPAAAVAPSASLADPASLFRSLPSLSDIELEGAESSMLELGVKGDSLVVLRGEDQGQDAPSSPVTALGSLQSFVSVRPGPHGMALLDVRSTGGATSCQDHLIGTLHVDRFLSSARKKIWWMIPSWGQGAKDVRPETQFLVGEVEDKSAPGGKVYVGLFPLLGQEGTFRGTLRGPARAVGVPMQGEGAEKEVLGL